LCEDTPALHELPASALSQIHVDPQTLRPGKTPPRLTGKTPKCFFALFAAFLGVMLRGHPAEPEIVHEELQSNPSLARAFQQFDQIMTEAGLWSEAKVGQVTRNLHTGRIAKVLDARATNSERPYFVMELVPGAP
jgi:hypothetical protein